MLMLRAFQTPREETSPRQHPQPALWYKRQELSAGPLGHLASVSHFRTVDSLVFIGPARFRIHLP